MMGSEPIVGALSMRGVEQAAQHKCVAPAAVGGFGRRVFNYRQVRFIVEEEHRLEAIAVEGLI